MTKIRYSEINKNKFEVILPDISDQPIGAVYKDDRKNKWFIKPFFVTLHRDSRKTKQSYDDFTKAGRSLVDMWSYTSFLTSDESTDEFNMIDMFKDIGP